MKSVPPSRRRFLRIAAVHTAALAVGLRAGRGEPELGEPRRWRGIGLGAEASIELYADDTAAADVALEACREELVRLETIFSLYDGLSALSELNRTKQLTAAPAELVEVLALAERVSVVSEGAFDVTIHPVCELLARGDAPAEDVARLVAQVDFRNVEIGGADVTLHGAETQVTLNGIAQGYITDRIVALLESRGFTSALVDLGEKRALGWHPEGRAWRIGVQSPFAGNVMAKVIDLRAGQAVATSGGYGTRYRDAQGRHHLLDARSGASRDDWSSVSVVADSAAVADALSTTLAVSRPVDAAAMLDSFPGSVAYVIGANASIETIGG